MSASAVFSKADMSASAVFTCCSNSHPFQERRVVLHEPTKIGRSVAQSRPSVTNAIFDCKVLSRNHALIWYENGKFFLQDTKSSNGTFVNSHRLSKGSEESSPREIFSNDTVQFGVDVIENSRKVTHSCIIATIQLFHADGQEAINSHSTTFANGSTNTTLQSQELYQLALCLQEALHREQMLENKLATLQRLVQSTQEATENGWQALIDEDRLLSRLEILENQLSVYGKLRTEESLRQELVALHDDKSSYETTAKESLRRVLEEKLEAVRKLSELERSLNNSEEECSHLQEMCQLSQKELQALAEKYQEQLQQLKDLNEKMLEMEKKQEEEQEEIEKEKFELQLKIEELVKQEDILHAKVESLQAENDFSTEQLNNMKAKLEAVKKMSSDSPKIPEFISRGIQVDLVNLLDLRMLQSNNEKSDDDEEDDDDDIRNEEINHKDVVESSLTTMLNIHSGINSFSESLSLTGGGVGHTLVTGEYANSEAQIQANRIRSLEEQLKLSDKNMNEMVDSAVSDLRNQLTALQKQLKNNGEQCKRWQDEVANLELQLSHYRKLDLKDMKGGSNIINTNVDSPVKRERMMLTENAIKTETNNVDLNQQVLSLKEQLEDAQTSSRQSNKDIEQLRLRLRNLQEDLEFERLKGSSTGSTNMTAVQEEIQREAARNRVEFCVLKDECSQLRERIQVIENEMKMSHRENIQLKADYSRLQMSYQELEELKQKLENKETTWQSNLTDAQKEADQTKSELLNAREKISQLQSKCVEYYDEIQSLRSELENTLDEYSILSYRSKTLSTCSMIPLLMLLFAFVLAFYPFLSTITATSVPPGT